MELKKTDTIVARYAKLPVIEPSHRYLVKVMEPLDLCELEKKIKVEDMRRLGTIPSEGYDKSNWDIYALEALKRLLLEEWHGYLKDVFECDDLESDENKAIMKNLSKVRLVECYLLVPIKEE